MNIKKCFLLVCIVVNSSYAVIPPWISAIATTGKEALLGGKVLDFVTGRIVPIGTFANSFLGFKFPDEVTELNKKQALWQLLLSEEQYLLYFKQLSEARFPFLKSGVSMFLVAQFASNQRIYAQIEKNKHQGIS